MKDNRIIANFDDKKFKPYKKNRSIEVEFDTHEDCMNWIDESETCKDFRPELGWDLGNGKYNSSWDWLMPVIDKIESIYDNSIAVKINGIDCTISTGSQYAIAYPEKDCHIEIRGKNRFEATYKAVVKFIKWYNSNELRLNKL